MINDYKAEFERRWGWVERWVLPLLYLTTGLLGIAIGVVACLK